MEEVYVRRISQQVGHCGPTCVAMALSVLGIDRDQVDIASATGADEEIANEGTRMDQLAAAVQQLAPGVVLLAKYMSSIDDLDVLTRRFGKPAIVEWQGRFVSGDGTRFDLGHYSIVTAVDMNAGIIRLVDPDDASAYTTGTIAIEEFKDRWWEVNDVQPAESSERMKIRTHGLSFVLVFDNDAGPFLDKGYEPGTLEYSIRSGKHLIQDT